MKKYELEKEIAYEWTNNPVNLIRLNTLKSWGQSTENYKLKDSIYDTADEALSKLKVGIRVRSKNNVTTLTAKRFIGIGKAGENQFEEYHAELNSEVHPNTITADSLKIKLPKKTLYKTLEITNKRNEISFTNGDSKILIVNEKVTYANTKRVYTEYLLEIEFSNVSSEIINLVQKELESNSNLKPYHEGKTDRAKRFLGNLEQMPLIENLKDIEPISMSAHGGKGLMDMHFFHQPFNHFTSQDIDEKVIGYQDTNWDFFGYARLPVGSEVKWHLHDKTDEIYFILKGSATINIDGNERIIKKGDCILTRKGSHHSISSVSISLEFIAIEVLRQG